MKKLVTFFEKCCIMIEKEREMNIYRQLNEMINYIEENLENEIEYEKMAKILGLNGYTMKSIFCVICNMSIAEYVRKRRLSNAGFDLCKDNEKIIDIALKYQYESATAFSRAFEKFHGIKPSKVKNNPEGLKIFTKLIFDENIKEKENVQYSIIERQEMILYGKGMKTNDCEISQDAPRFFAKMQAKYRNKYGRIKYGMVVYEDRFESDKFEYWVLYDKKIDEFEKYVIPKSKWIKFDIFSQDEKEIQEMSHKFYVEILPVLKYNLRNIPELEYYHDNITEFWIPIEN